MRILVTGVTGKVGRHLLPRLLADPRFSEAAVVALCFSRRPEIVHDRLEVVQGSIEHLALVETAMAGVTHVVHLATCKETPSVVMDVAVKGMFWLLETFRQSASAQQFMLIGGDAAVGHFIYPQPGPVTEDTPFTATPGCYGLAKVLEEVMLGQYYVQYGIDGCCLRAPWLMAEDDFRAALSFGPEVFGSPRWCDLVGDTASQLAALGAVPAARDITGAPLRRSILHVEDLVDAILKALDNPAARQQTFNIAMDRPVDYAETAALVHARTGAPVVDIATRFHSVFLDNSKAKAVLGWAPHYDPVRLVDAAWAFERRTGRDAPLYPG